MELIVEYAYTQHVNITEEDMHEVLITADHMAMRVLVSEGCTVLKAQMCVENCIGIWKFSHSYFCKAFQFILYNSEEFLDLRVEQISEIIENDELNVKQENMGFEAVLQ